MNNIKIVDANDKHMFANVTNFPFIPNIVMRILILVANVILPGIGTIV